MSCGVVLYISLYIVDNQVNTLTAPKIRTVVLATVTEQHPQMESFTFFHNQLFKQGGLVTFVLTPRLS